MLVNAAGMLKAAKAGHYGIAAFNTNDLEWTRSILTAAEETQSPVIIQCTSGAAKWQKGFQVVADVVRDMLDSMDITVPVALHLDHGSYEDCFKCIDAGFTSIMYDGSHEAEFQTNIDHTKELVKLAHQKGLSIEAEVGGIGGTEDGVTAEGELADPEQCEAIANLGVDFLACGIGNIHGPYPADWKGLNFDQLAAIQEKTGDLPLVLHGGSGIPKEQVLKAVSLGVAKININTELQLSFHSAMRAYVESCKDLEGKNYDPRKFLKPGFDAITETAEGLIRDFGSDGKGWNF
jgi:fructose-bisphosphate aldolase class II